MRKKIILFVAILIASTVVSAESFGESHDKVQNYFKSGQENKVKDALWTSPNIFKVGVLDDGKSRDGYAMYVCEVLYEYGFKGKHIWVQVIDIGKLVKNGKWDKLGEAHCL